MELIIDFSSDLQNEKYNIFIDLRETIKRLKSERKEILYGKKAS